MRAECMILSLVGLMSQASGEKTNVAPVPEILEKAIAHRTTFHTASVSMRRVWENKSFGRRVDNFDIRIAGDDEYWIESGDDDGLLMTDLKTGAPSFGTRNMALPREHLWNHEAKTHWTHWNSNEFFDLTPSSVRTFYVDIRTIGLQEVEIDGDTTSGIRERLGKGPAKKYTVAKAENHLVRVYGVEPVANPVGSYLETEWIIDESKGPSIIQKAAWLCRPGEPQQLLSECRVQLIQIDGRWWPARSEIVSPAGGTRLLYEFKHLEFDRSSHPTIIDADYFGIPPGARVFNVLDGKPKPERYIGGGQTVSEAEWKEIKEAYDPAPLARFESKMRAMGDGCFPKWWKSGTDDFGIEGVSGQPDQWEAYVRRWVMRHTPNHRWTVIEPLTNEQKTAAQSVLNDCRNRAKPIRAHCDEDLIATRLLLVDLELKAKGGNPESAEKATGSSQQLSAESGGHAKQVAALKEKIAKLEEPKEIAVIFSELKSRLDALLTSKQREPTNGSYQQPTIKTIRLPDGGLQIVHSE